MRLFRTVLARRQASIDGDDGFSMIEVIVAIFIVGVVMTAAGGFFINSIRATGGASARQNAVIVTDQALNNIGTVPGTSLLRGRTLTQVTTLLATDTGGVLTGRDDTSNATSAALDYDPTAVGAAVCGTVATTSCAVPPMMQQKVNNVLFSLRQFIDPCWLPVNTTQAAAATKNLACVASSAVPNGASAVTKEYRVTVSTSWASGAGTSCAAGCSYNDSTIVDPNSDATFNSNISIPTITAVSPATVGGGASTTLTLTGTNFVYGASVAITCPGCSATVGTIDQTTNTGTTIKVPVTFGSASGTATIALTNPDGGRATFSITVNTAPAVTSISPSSVVAGKATTVMLTGTNLSASTSVAASGGTVGAVSYSSGVLSVTYTGVNSAPTPTFTVTNPDMGTTTISGLTVVPQSTPTIVSISPTTEKGGTTVTYTVTGTGFLTGTKPTINFAVSGYTLYYGPATTVTSTTATFQFTLGAVSSTTVYPGITVQLINSDGGTSNTLTFTNTVTP